MMIRCTKCGEEKPPEEFYKRSRKKNGLDSWCKICHLANALERREADPEKYRGRSREWERRNPRKVKAYHLRRKYGIEIADYESLLEAQNDACAICCEKGRSSGWSLAVDHDHDTGEIRGLLCMRCNHGLGQFKDDPNLLLRARAYLDGA